MTIEQKRRLQVAAKNLQDAMNDVSGTEDIMLQVEQETFDTTTNGDVGTRRIYTISVRAEASEIIRSA